MTTIGLAPWHLRDLAAGLQQQMFFWGQDVVHPAGNLLVRNGFERLPSKGLKGTSCYRREWQGGIIELYGSCAGWYGPKEGFTFMRPRKRVVIWDSGETTPIPGKRELESIRAGVSKEELHAASRPFLDWLISYERKVIDQFGIAYREENYLKYDKVPKATSWIWPEAALRWMTTFRDSPDELVRPKQLS